MGNGKRKNTGQGSQDSSAWMVTFSDLVMLLLTFFVLILTMSSMDQKKLKEIFRHLQEAVGVLEFAGFGSIERPAEFGRSSSDTDSKIVLDQAVLENLMTASREMNRTVREAIEEIAKMTDVMEDERGIVVSLRESILFEAGEVRLKPEAFPLLEQLAEAIEACRNPILVTGHSDETPLRNLRYDSNYELSLRRALSVLDYFLIRKSLASSRFLVGAAGASRPLSSNGSPESRALNRRVEIIFSHIEGI